MTYSKEHFLNDVFLTLQEHIKKSSSNETVVDVSSPSELKKIIPALKEEGISSTELVNELTEILNHSVRTSHPLFLNQLFGGFDEAGWAGEIASTLLNPTMATFEVAPVLTLLEKRVVSELLQMLGFTEGEGIMVTGGSNSNLLAMLCARTKYDTNIRQTGFQHNKFRIYVSSEAHYSFDKAANITGIGTRNLMLVPADEKGEMIPEELDKMILSDIEEGLIPIMVGATCGTTVMGAFDPLQKIAEISKKHNLWLHVDAAWGGGALFSQSHRQLFDGVEHADSLTFDAHKSMGTPLITSFFLTKHAGILKDTNRGGGSEYIFHEYDNSIWDTGTYSLQCGRKADILKFWLLWRKYGTRGLIERTEHLFDLAKFAEKEVSENPRFKLIHAHYLNVCFQVHARHDQEDINSFTLKVREAMMKEGRTMVNYAQRPDGTLFFRLVLANHRTTRAHLSELFKIILETADRLTII